MGDVAGTTRSNSIYWYIQTYLAALVLLFATTSAHAHRKPVPPEHLGAQRLLEHNEKIRVHNLCSEYLSAPLAIQSVPVPGVPGLRIVPCEAGREPELHEVLSSVRYATRIFKR